MSNTGIEKGVISTEQSAFPVGMTYVPIQKFENLYSENEALGRGTVFRELDYPFQGKGGTA